MYMFAATTIITIEVTTTEEVTKMYTFTTTIYLPGGNQDIEVLTARSEGAEGNMLAGRGG